MLSYGRLTVDFGIVVFARTRWLFSYGVTFLPDARGDILPDLRSVLRASLSRNRLSFIQLKLVSSAYMNTEALLTTFGRSLI